MTRTKAQRYLINAREHLQYLNGLYVRYARDTRVTANTKMTRLGGKTIRECFMEQTHTEILEIREEISALERIAYGRAN